TRKTYNPDSLRAQEKSIWKTKKKFEIQVAGQNLFMIMFEAEEDLEQILEDNQGKIWLSFKYENLLTFYFRCGHLGHGVKNYMAISSEDHKKAEDDLPYSLALKAESSLLRRESLKFSFSTKKTMNQCYYTGDEAMSKDGGSSTEVLRKDQRKVKEASLEKTPIFLETNNMRQISRDSIANLSPQITLLI
ncbi:hypothetical protein Godav_000875, partial [Gossypium davidsonii]|nr:hypothetical protein [Gossypium davidsonii]